MVITRKRRGTNNQTDNQHDGINSILLPEIIFNILLRLSAYDLLRIKTVCRMWFEIICSREFVVANLDFWRNRPEIIYLDLNDHWEYFLESLDIETKLKKYQLSLGKFVEEDMHIMSSLDGLILFMVVGYTTRRIYICNPLTQKFKLLLYVPPSWDHGGPAYTLVYDPVQKNYKVIGFCYRTPDLYIEKKYCVLSFSNDEGRRRTRGDFKVPVWRNVDSQFRHVSRLNFGAISIGRVLYWVAFSVADTVSYIQTMDIVDEVFSDKIPLPCQPAHVHWGTCRLLRMESRESVYVGIPSSKSELGIWRLESGDDYVWIKQHNIVLETIVGRPHSLVAFNDYKFELHLVVDQEDSDGMKLVLRFERSLYTYNLKSREMTLLINRASNSSYVSSFISWEKCKNVIRI